MTKGDLIKRVMEATHTPPRMTKSLVETVFDEIVDALKRGEDVLLPGIGTNRDGEAQKNGHPPTKLTPKSDQKKNISPKSLHFLAGLNSV
ncbi:MAG: HU family DNA-binding protein [Pseudomonadota bacterium]